jgi:DNA topoisomerase-1
MPPKSATKTSTKKTKTSSAVETPPPVEGAIPIILESPNKIKKLISFLPRGKYIVLASCGHFRKLSNSYGNMGFQVNDSGIKIEYVEEESKKTVIANLKRQCKSANVVYLATDPDREGEAIAWHIMELLGKKKDYYRVRFNSITRGEVLAALEKPTRIDMNLVLAQQTRSIIDKWIGFKVSPLCWAAISKMAKSAGRVQSPALKLLVEREREIIHFKPEEYFTITAAFNINKKEKMLDVPLHNYLDMKKPLNFRSEEGCMKAIGIIEERCKVWKLTIKDDESPSHPPPPYTTLTMLQDCHTYLRMNPDHAMAALQKMYESGWITYHRTDSVVLSTEGVFATREAVEALHPELLTEKPRNYTNKNLNAQEAHEPIRPTHYEIINLDNTLTSEDKAKLDPRVIKMYSMIYLRTLATQCKPLLNTTINFLYTGYEGADGTISFSKTFSFLKDLGWKSLYSDKKINLYYTKALSEIEKIPKWLVDLQRLKKLESALEEFGLETHHTIPPPFFTSSTLIKELESLGIGRPSTYASIITKLFDNKYIYEKDNKLHPAPVALELVDFLEGKYKEHFMNLEYTQCMEKTLDDIAEGKCKWDDSVKGFIHSFPVS